MCTPLNDPQLPLVPAVSAIVDIDHNLNCSTLIGDQLLGGLLAASYCCLIINGIYLNPFCKQSFSVGQPAMLSSSLAY